MPYKVTGKILEVECGWGVSNVVVEVWDKDDVGKDDRLGSTVTLPDGTFAILFREGDFQEGFFDRKPDLYLLAKKPDGMLLHTTEAETRFESGRHESFVFQIPHQVLGEMAPRREPQRQGTGQSADVLSIQDEEFVEHAIGEERSARTRAILIATAITLIASAVLGWWFLESSESRAANRIFDKWGRAVVHIQAPDETGSGVIFDKKGHILTNYHVVDAGSPLQVRLGDGRTVEAQVVGFDLNNDLAVIEVEATENDLIVAPRGDSNKVKVGDLSIAIGNPLRLERSLTVGHVSAVNRVLATSDPFGAVIDGVVQTDAAINPGSSGGPLFNARGKVIGINTQIITLDRSFAGIGMAIPINLAEEIAEELIANGVVTRPFLGVKALVLGGDQGLQVEFVAGRSAAAEAGIRVGDVILAANQQAVGTAADLHRLVEKHVAGDDISLDIQRGSERISTTAVLKARPAPDEVTRIVEVQLADGANDPNKEWVEIENQGFRTVYLQGYTLSNGNGEAFTFPDVALSPLRRVRVYTGAGADDEDALYWNASAPVWSEADEAVLLDASGNQVDELGY